MYEVNNDVKKYIKQVNKIVAHTGTVDTVVKEYTSDGHINSSSTESSIATIINIKNQPIIVTGTTSALALSPFIDFAAPAFATSNIDFFAPHKKAH